MLESTEKKQETYYTKIPIISYQPTRSIKKRPKLHIALECNLFIINIKFDNRFKERVVNLLIRGEISMKNSFVAFLKGLVSVMAVLVFVVGVSGCQKQEGPMEKAGKKVDESVEATKDSMKKAGQKVSEGAKQTKEAVKNAAEESRR